MSNALLLVIAVALFFFSSANSDESSKKLLKPGRCKGLWRNDRLIGRCFGLHLHNEYEEYKSLVISTAEECRALCCNMEEKCISWQFFTKTGDSTSKECRITDKIIRLGDEITGTADWCEPHAPSKWNGMRIESRNADGTCTWGEQLPTQCFGLGPPRHKAGTTIHLNTEECAAACCEDKECGMFQEIPGRGCFFASSNGVWCDKDGGQYDGARKCVPGFCDGQEQTILAAYNASKASLGHLRRI